MNSVIDNLQNLTPVELEHIANIVGKRLDEVNADKIAYWESLSSTKFLEVIANTKPTLLTNTAVVEQTKFLLSQCSAVCGPQNKATIAFYIFKMLEINHYFLERHSKFHDAVTAKLVEFSTDRHQAARQIAANFWHLRKTNNPKCHYCSKAGKWMIIESGDPDTKFCSEKCLEDFVDNGDCVKDLAVTVDALDAELEEYTAARN